MIEHVSRITKVDNASKPCFGVIPGRLENFDFGVISGSYVSLKGHLW